MTDGSNAPRADLLDEQESKGGEPGDTVGTDGSHGRAEDIRAVVVTATEKTREAAGRALEAAKMKASQNPRVAVAADRTRSAAGHAIGAVRGQVGQRPGVAAVVGRTVSSSGKAARSAGQQARRHPRITGGLTAGAVLFAAGRASRRRRSKARAGAR